jgi:hypothetical protein
MLECHAVRMSSTATLDRLPRDQGAVGQNNGVLAHVCPMSDLLQHEHDCRSDDHVGGRTVRR